MPESPDQLPEHLRRRGGDRATPMSELLAERDLPGMWEYDAQLCAADGTLRRIVLRLSWADYNLWAPDGTIPPGSIADAVLHFIAQHEAAFAGMERIDASAARRRVPGADAAIDALIRS